MKNLAFAFSFAAVAATAFAHPLDNAPWIGDGRPEPNGAEWYAEDPAPQFCAEFTVPDGVKKVTVHFACAGFGYFSLGGRQMSVDGLDTLWSVYDRTVYATTVKDIEVKSAPEKNKVIVDLGNGFYNIPPLRFWGSKCFRDALAHGRPCFKLTIDEVKEPLVWKWHRTKVIRNSVYLGTEIDATRRPDGTWKAAAVVKGPKGAIVEWPRTNPQMGCQEIHKGQSKWVGKVQVVDFGVNASGVPRFAFHGEERGTKIEIVYGERLNADGTVNVLTQTAGQIKRGNGGPGAPYLACQRDLYVCHGVIPESNELPKGFDRTLDEFKPQFTWHIFRYAEIRGAKNLLGPGDAERVVRSMVSTTADLAPAAKKFKTDNEDLRKLHEVCQRTFQANLIGGVQSDCPGRERLGYGGDIVATCEALCLNFSGMKEIYLKILRDFADEAAGDGWITETAPYVGIADALGIEAGGMDRRGPISWALGVPVMMETLMRHYPDVTDRVLAFYPVCSRYIGLMDKAHPDGIVPKCIGDHEALERAPDEVTATAHWHEFVRLTATFAHKLGKTDDAARFEALARKIAAAFQTKYVKNGIVANGSQSAQAIGLYLGLVPKMQVKKAEAQLLKAIEASDYGPMTGIFSTRYMLMYLSEHGKRDVAEKIVLHKGYPGWLHMIEQGGTTLWETWKESDDTFSNCHPMFGSVDEWILRFAR